MKIKTFGFLAVMFHLAWWGFWIWLICCVAWPWLANILRANGLKGI